MYMYTTLNFQKFQNQFGFQQQSEWLWWIYQVNQTNTSAKAK